MTHTPSREDDKATVQYALAAVDPTYHVAPAIAALDRLAAAPSPDIGAMAASIRSEIARRFNEPFAQVVGEMILNFQPATPAHDTACHCDYAIPGYQGDAAKCDRCGNVLPAAKAEAVYEELGGLDEAALQAQGAR